MDISPQILPCLGRAYIAPVIIWGFFWVAEVSIHTGVHAVYEKATGCEHLGVTCLASPCAQLSTLNLTSVPSRSLKGNFSEFGERKVKTGGNLCL